MADLINQTIFQTVKRRNWDFYRNCYLDGEYSFQDLIEINNLWFKLLKEQSCFNLKCFLAAFLKYDGEIKTVVELGCYTGLLAKEILNSISSIEKWVGYDISSEAIKQSGFHDRRYIPFALNTWLYLCDIGEFDVFVSAHTLEHMSVTQVVRTLNHVKDKCRIIMLEVPIKKEGGKVWRGGASSHVLNNYGRKHFRKWFMENNFSIKYEYGPGMNWFILAEKEEK